MGYQRRNMPIDYKRYGQKKKPGWKTRIRARAFLLILVVGGAVLWMVIAGRQQKESAMAVLGDYSYEVRKSIYDRSLEPLAVSFELYAVYVKPLEVEDSFRTGEILATILDLDREELVKRLRKEQSFIWLGHRVAKEKVAELIRHNIAGLYFQKAPVRFYPHGETAAQVLGYVKDEQGLDGVELFYDKELRPRTIQGITAHAGDQLFREGSHLVLTLDLKIQTILEKQMALLLDKTQASSVAAMAVDPATGEIIASAQLPSFNPNSFWNAPPQSQKMDMVSRTMNPGGISGILRYGAAVHAGVDVRMRSVADEPVPVVKPRQLKSGTRARAGYWWPWPGGGFISDELAELPDPSIAEEALLGFQRDLGISCADLVDLPAKAASNLDEDPCAGGRLNGVSLLGAFARLVNGGKVVPLHFLRGTMDGEGRFAARRFTGNGREMPEVSAVLRESFAASAGAEAPFFAAEYLFPLGRDDDFVLESQEGDQASSVVEGEQTFDGLLVAVAPIKKPQLVLLVSVQNGDFDVRAASPMRRFANTFLEEAAKKMESGNTSSDVAGLPDTSRLFQAWQQQQKLVVTGETLAPTASGKMPDLLGKSLRKALRQLMACRVEVEIVGAGRVVGQQPEPGQECGERVQLRLAVQEQVQEGAKP
ncbi:MAG: hypothetical protein C0613_00585 [Desulfobulbaceae bacterium]|nr:MAG: hypothetical protein C0613_00585 [Desulfobulbaceae bacterium]